MKGNTKSLKANDKTRFEEGRETSRPVTEQTKNTLGRQKSKCTIDDASGENSAQISSEEEKGRTTSHEKGCCVAWEMAGW